MKISKIHDWEPDRIMIQFPFQKKKATMIKNIEGVAWSQTLKVWHIHYKIESYEKLIKLIPEAEGSILELSKAKTVPEKKEITELHSIKKEVNIEDAGRKIFVKLPKNDDDTRFILSLRFSKLDKKDWQWIIPNYPGNLDQLKGRFKLRINRTNFFEEFINYYFMLDINTINEKQIIGFLRYLVTERKISTSSQNQAINAIKFYFEKVLGGQRKFYFIDRPRREHKLPELLSTEETKQLFAVDENKKHLAILMLGYSAGLRLGEIVRLKIADIDRDRMQIRVVQSKGKKDRYVKLSVKFLMVMDEYIEKYHSKVFLFEGAEDVKYSPRSIQNMIRDNVAKTSITFEKRELNLNTKNNSIRMKCINTSLKDCYSDDLSKRPLSYKSDIPATVAYTQSIAVIFPEDSTLKLSLSF